MSSSSARGASVLGCSMDVAWALQGAARSAAVYPVEGRPKTYEVERLKRRKACFSCFSKHFEVFLTEFR